MAARENQGLFISVILLVLLSVVLAVATFFGYSGMQEVADQRDSLEEQYNAERAASQGYEAQANILKAYLGVEGRSIVEVSTYQSLLASAGNQDLVNEMARITEAYDDDMANVSVADEGTDLNYRKALADMMSAMSEQHSELTVRNNTISRMELEHATSIQNKDNELTEKDNQLRKARNDLATEQNNHSLTRTELQGQLDSTERQLSTARQSLSETQQSLASAKTTHNNELEAREATIRQKEAEIVSLTERETDVADGQIVSVSSILGQVYINLGSRDNLRLKQTFAIYDQNVSTFKSGKGKATIEVTNILDDHLAEARITSQDPLNPILTSDFVVTSTWSPGDTVGVAIVGRIDLDGDGRSDLQRLISIVEQNGGKVVAYHDEDGNVFGEIDEATRFFVKGKDPLGNMTDGYNRLDRQRERFQTRPISVLEFIAEMGYRSEAKIQRFDDNLPSVDFKPRQPTTVDQGSPFEGGN